jgi:hypothetical protein
MRGNDSAISGANRARASGATAARGHAARMLAACLTCCILGAAVTEAGWLGSLVAAGETSRPGGHDALERLAARLRDLPAASPAALAAQATPGGAWRFANRAGEVLTAGTPDEMQRVASVLLPEVGADARLAIYLDEDTVFRHPVALANLPKASELTVVVDRDCYGVIGRGEAGGRLFAEVRPNLLVELNERRAFEEAVWQLQRPLEAAEVRVLALEPGAPPILPNAPRADAISKRALIDAIEPASLPAALGSVRGQTVLITARVDGRALFVQPASGSERSLILADLFAAAEKADVNLVVLHAAATPRQPGGRNWLWQKVEVSGLDQALQRARVADFFNALGAANRPLLASAVVAPRRTSLTIRPLGEASGPASPSGVGDMFSAVLAEMTGRVVITAVVASLRSAERQRELELRIIPGVPADVAAAYLLFVVFGLVGAPASRPWWRRLWPPEAAAEYSGRPGYFAARTIRGLAFLLVFLPLSACLSLPLVLARSVSGAAVACRRLLRSGTRRRAAAGG